MPAASHRSRDFAQAAHDAILVLKRPALGLSSAVGKRARPYICFWTGFSRLQRVCGIEGCQGENWMGLDSFFGRGLSSTFWVDGHGADGGGGSMLCDTRHRE